MKWNALMLLPAIGFVMAVSLGCSEETKGKASDAVSATKDAAESAGGDLKDAGGEMMDKAKDVGADVADKVETVAGDVKEKLADETEELEKDGTEQLSDALGGGELMTQAQDLIKQAQEFIANNNFGDAQALLDKLKALPGGDKLEGITGQIESLQAAIDKGKELAESAGSVMGK